MKAYKPRPNRRMTVVATTAALVAAAQVPATAAPDPGEPRHPGVTASANNCSLTRVEQQFVRSDYLTGAGVPAPLWIPEG